MTITQCHSERAAKNPSA